MLIKKEKIVPILKGIAGSLLPLKRLRDPSATGGTINSRYCYTVWMRHLITANKNGYKGVPAMLVELGPGDSLGVGLAALLSGTAHYCALDVFDYADNSVNLRIFDELIELFRNRTVVPGNNEFPFARPILNCYDFPATILTDEYLGYALAEDRVQKIRQELETLTLNRQGEYIQYCVPWQQVQKIAPGTVDMVFSQSVLQYADDLESTYGIMANWLKQEGLMSHCIDLSSHGLTQLWNGHWTFSKLEWKLARGKRIIGLNRAPGSYHILLHEQNGLTIVEQVRYYKNDELKKAAIAKAFRTLSAEDKRTASLFIQSVKR